MVERTDMMAMMMTFLEELGLSNYQRQGNTGGEGMVAFPHSPLALFFFFLNGDQLVHTNSIFLARISPKWLRELRRLWLGVP